ncbi:MAG TPA: cation diffusion facilitator family transporter [Gammaproteobacteria bacterium]|nr:cation diffusion facilitator family transporter [Gammaproteobacteria bacterium]
MYEHDHHRHDTLHARPLGAALALTLAFAVLEALAGWWSGSLALLSDAGHMMTDAAGLAIALLAAFIARRPATERHSYGFGRFEVIAAIANAMFMVGVVVAIAIAAFGRLQTPSAVQAVPVVAVALLGLLLNVSVAWMLSHGEQTLNVRGALLHVMSDLLGSLAALASGLVIWLTGWTPIDPILSLLICALILVSSVRLLREALHVVMEGVPAGIDLPEVGHSMATVAGVRSVHDLHIWTVTSGTVALSAHVVVDDLAAWPAVLDALRRHLRELYAIEHVTLQPEPLAQPLRKMEFPRPQD